MQSFCIHRVDWGDGSPLENITLASLELGSSAEAQHNYAAGEQTKFTITITGTIQGFAFNNFGHCLRIVDISSWGPLRLGNGGGYFHGCANLNISATDVPDLQQTSNFDRFFAGAGIIGDLNSWYAELCCLKLDV